MSHLTLEDIAKRAGVSRSTVSRVINNHPSISDSAKERVLEVINVTGYQPNAAARTLASQRSYIIGLVLPHSASALFADPYYPYLLKGITRACNALDFTLAFFLASSREDEEQIFSRIPNRGLLDGVLVQSGHHGHLEIVDRLIETQIPQVVVGRPFFPETVSFVDVDNVAGGKVAVEHLIRLGYRRIGMITGPLQSTAGIDRQNGYLQALEEHNLPFDPALVVEGDFTDPGGYQAMQRLIPQKPEAVFAASDVMAIGAIRAMKEQDLCVPEDIALVGFDDIPLTTLTNFQLTTVHQPVVELGVRAVELLIDLIRNGTEPHRHEILMPELVVRSSCGYCVTKENQL